MPVINDTKAGNREVCRQLYHASIVASSQKPHIVASPQQLIDSVLIKPSDVSGATESLIISQPLISRTLGQLIAPTSIPTSSRLLLLEKMFEGRAFLYGELCMHRDIKPENILASESPVQAVMIDFGCAT